MPAQQLLEAALADPDALDGRIQVDEEAQDAVAMRRAIRARIDVDQLVAGVRRQTPATFLLGTGAGCPRSPGAGELRHAALQEVADAGGMRAQDPARAVDDGARRLQASQLVRTRVVADVLPPEMGRKARAQELLIGGFWKRNGALREIDDAATLQRIRPVAPVGVVQHEDRGP